MIKLKSGEVCTYLNSGSLVELPKGKWENMDAMSERAVCPDRWSDKKIDYDCSNQLRYIGSHLDLKNNTSTSFVHS